MFNHHSICKFLCLLLYCYQIHPCTMNCQPIQTCQHRASYHYNNSLCNLIHLATSQYLIHVVCLQSTLLNKLLHSIKCTLHFHLLCRSRTLQCKRPHLSG
jgi:hypothetical protein